LANTPRRIRLMLALTGALIAVGIGLTWLLNPLGATRSRFIDPIFRKIKVERVTTPYLLRIAQPQIVLLGSSRVRMGMRIEQGERDGIMNAAINGATLKQISQIVKVALRNPRLRRIIWGVDFFAFSGRWDSEDPSFNARMENSPEARLEDTLLSLDALGDGFDLLRRSLRGRVRLPPTMRANVPWPTDLICDQFVAGRMDGLPMDTPEEIEMQMRQVLLLYRRYEFSRAQMDIFRDTVQDIRAHKIDLLLFVPPMSEYELELIRLSGHAGDLDSFKRAIATVAPYYDFAAYNAMAPRDDFYVHVVHFKAAAGYQIMRLLLGMDLATCNDDARIVAQSALWVNAASADRVLATEAEMRDRAVAQDSRYSRMAAEAVRLSSSDVVNDSGDLGSAEK
jgi:hypothetical protein